jgi:hypothetical protein
MVFNGVTTMSIVQFNKWKWADGTNRNHLVQMVNVTSSAIANYFGDGGTRMEATPGTGNQFSSDPTSTEGVQLLTTTFQPRFADSYILLQSTNIDVSESNNQSDDARIFAHAGSTLLGHNLASVSYESFGNSYNAYNMTLMIVANSWGTDSRTIRLGMSSTNNTNASYWYINHRYQSNYAVAPYSLTIMEIAK